MQAARALGWMLAAGLAAACSPSVDYDGTEYRCNESGLCPEGYSCIDGQCLSQRPDPDAEPDDDDDDDDDDRIDARKDEGGMLRSSSQPEVLIPDDFDQGVVDAVHFDVDCTVTDVTVDISISHDWPGDLFIVLQSPSDTEVELRDSSSSGDGEGDGIEGTYPITLEPAESLDAFIGDDSGGAWLLWVADVDDGDAGVLHQWAVNLWCND